MDSFPGTSLSLCIAEGLIANSIFKVSQVFYFCFGLDFMNHQVYTPENKQNKHGSPEKWRSGKGDEPALTIMLLQTNKS